MKTIVLAAGKGERMLSEEHDMPKVMRMANDRPLISYVLENINFIPEKDIAVVVGYKKEKVLENISDKYNFFEQEEQLGTGHAVKCAKPIFNGDLSGDVLVCYGNMPLFSEETYKGLIDAHEKNEADCTVLTAIAPNSGLRYGRIIRENGEFKAITEYDDCNDEQKKIDELNAGVYVFKAEKLFSVLDKLKTDNVQGKYHLTDVPKFLLETGSVETFTINNLNEIYGVNTPEELEFCEDILRRMTKLSEKKAEARWFGTGGWRTIIGDEFTKQNVCILSQAIADEMNSKDYKEIVIGYDRRFLSDMAAAWSAEVLAGNGITVYFINRIAPTPLIMFTVKSSEVKYGIAVTASHNPAEYNGMKIFTEGGRDAALDVTDVFEERIQKGVNVTRISFDEGVKNGAIRIIDPNNDYIDSIISMINMGAIRKSSLRVLLDPMFGVSKTTLQTILMTARCDVDIINDRHDTLFGGRLPSPTAATLTKLRDMVVQHKYDLGIGTDGDADRIGIIDNTGRFIHPNEILVLLYYYLLEYKGWRGDCVRNIATTHTLDKIAEAYGQKCHEVPVGFKHISMKMEESDAIIGGESSGGLTIKGHIKGKDGIFASALIAEMISVSGLTISQLLEQITSKYGTTIMTEYDTKFSEEVKQDLQKLLFKDKKLPDFGEEIEKVSYLDGCKVYFKNGGWIIARFSGTEPLIRIFCEMKNEAEANRITKSMRDFLGV